MVIMCFPWYRVQAEGKGTQDLRNTSGSDMAVTLFPPSPVCGVCVCVCGVCGVCVCVCVWCVCVCGVCGV